MPVIRAIDRKLLRDLWHLRGQSLAIAAVVAAGVATFVMSLSTLRSLEGTMNTYYDRYRFAHVFAHLKRAPRSLADRIAAIPGVAAVDPRVVVDVNLDVAGLAEPAIGRLISVPAFDGPKLNRIHLRSGRMIDPTRPGEALVGELFAESLHLGPGDSVRAVINGRLQTLHIVGVALSPEYVLQIREGELLPDAKRFGIFWVDQTELATAYNLDGAFNSVALELMRGADQQAVIEQLDHLIEPYGGAGSYGRADQLSNRFLSDEIRQLRGMALIVPSIFLGVAAFLLNVVMGRLVATQREQVAALKAFGYTNRRVGAHYLKFALAITGVGVVLGIGFGAWMGHGLTDMYTRFYKFPIFGFRLGADTVLLAVAVSATAAFIGTAAAVRRAVKLPPAEAMRPEPPADFRPTFLERLGLQRLLSPAARMILRHLERQPVKAAMSVLGIALAASVLVVGSFMEDSLDYLITHQFYLAQRHDVTVSLVEPASSDATYAMAHLPGVVRSEPFRSVPARLRFEHRHRRLAVTGLAPGGNLMRLLDADERLVAPPPDGLLLSAKLADVLGVSVGDRVTVEVLEGERPVRSVPVAALIADFSGLNAYMAAPALNALMHEGETVSGAFLSVDSAHLPALYRDLKTTPRVAAVTVKAAALQSFNDTISENMMRMRMFNVLFATIIAFGVVYNTARVSLSERGRELATLRVIGFTRAEISAILLGELAVLTLLALPVGLAMGYGFAALSMLSLDTEVYRFPLIVGRATFAFAALVVIVAALLSGLVVRRKLDRLDLVAVLKTRE